MIHQITHNNKILAIIIKRNFQKDGIEFFTPDDFSQQLAYMKRPKGYIIKPHVHNIVERKVRYTQEVLFIKKGKVRVDFYDDERNYLKSIILEEGDVILLAHGGHGFEMIEETEIIEVKQGPYAGDMDKIRFEPVDKNQISTEDV
jgi:mannose-6-phosphate isomerase-like protein (cupin superfamily)